MLDYSAKMWRCGRHRDSGLTQSRLLPFVFILYVFGLFFFGGGGFGVEEIRGKSRTDLRSEMVDFFSQNCRFIFLTGADQLVIDVSEFLFHLLSAARWIWILF